MYVELMLIIYVASQVVQRRIMSCIQSVISQITMPSVHCTPQLFRKYLFSSQRSGGTNLYPCRILALKPKATLSVICKATSISIKTCRFWNYVKGIYVKRGRAAITTKCVSLFGTWQKSASEKIVLCFFASYSIRRDCIGRVILRA